MGGMLGVRREAGAREPGTKIGKAAERTHHFAEEEAVVLLCEAL